MSSQTQTATAGATGTGPSGANPSGWAISGGGGTFSALNGGSWTRYLFLTGFGFSIPAGATISDISATITRTWSTHVGSPTATTDDSVQLIIGGSVSGGELSSGATWSGAQAYDAGTAGAVTVSQINDNTNFGVAISGKANGAGSSDLSVSSASITVTYTTSEDALPPRAAMTASPLSPRRAAPSAYQPNDYPPNLRTSATQEGADEIARRMEIWN